MSNVLLQAEEARLLGIFYSDFITKYPEVEVARVHDCWIFARQEDARTFVEEFEKFIQEAGGTWLCLEDS